MFVSVNFTFAIISCIKVWFSVNVKYLELEHGNVVIFNVAEFVFGNLNFFFIFILNAFGAHWPFSILYCHYMEYRSHHYSYCMIPGIYLPNTNEIIFFPSFYATNYSIWFR